MRQTQVVLRDSFQSVTETTPTTQSSGPVHKSICGNLYYSLLFYRYVGGVSFLSVWRRGNSGKYTYISKSQLLNNTAGYHKHNLVCPLEVKKGDLIGLQHQQEPMELAYCDIRNEGITYPCSTSAYGQVIAVPKTDSALVLGRTYSFTPNCQRIYALQVHFV